MSGNGSDSGLDLNSVRQFLTIIGGLVLAAEQQHPPAANSVSGSDLLLRRKP
jgi:hypothetical protein